MNPPISVLTRSIDAAHTEIDPKRGLVRAIISDDSNDRFNTIFDPEGCDWSGWQAGGSLVLYEHGKSARGHLPVGNAESLERTTFKGRRSLLMATRFFDDDEFAKQVGDLYRSERMKGWSIHARALEQSPPTREERMAWDDWSRADLVYRRWELLEASCVAIPGNTNTNTIEITRALERTLAGGDAKSRSRARARSEQLTPEQAQGLMAEARRGITTMYGNLERKLDPMIAQARVQRSMVKAAAAGSRPIERGAGRGAFVTHSAGQWLVHDEAGRVLSRHGSEWEAQRLCGR